MRYSRLTALILSAALALSLALPAQAAEGDGWLIDKVKDAPSFTDTAGIWCQAEVETVCQAGLMEGKSADRFAAADPLTNAQVIVIAARTYTALAGKAPVAQAEEGEPWYQPSYDCLAALEENAGDKGRSRLLSLYELQRTADDPCTRGAFANLLLLALDGADVTLPERNTLTAATPDLPPEHEVYTLYRAGILAGTDAYGTFDSEGRLNRGQAAAMLARLVDPEKRQSFTLEPLDACRDILGLDPYATALTIDGTSIRADVMTFALCSALKTQYNRLICDGPSANHLEAVVPEATAAMKEDLALERLAAERGITVTEEDLEETYGSMVSGYRGLSEAAQKWENTHNLMKSRLSALYNEQYGSEAVGPSPGAPSWGEEALDNDLWKLMEQMTVQTASTLEQLDLSAAQMRLVQSPLF